MRNKTFRFFLSGLVLIFLFSAFLPYYIFPGDILSYFPSFSAESWVRPNNFLLADPIFQFEPWRHYVKQRLLGGDFPLWNNLNAHGAPFFANQQSAVLYPLNFLYYLFPFSVGLNLIYFLKLYLFGFFTFLYFRSIRLSHQVSVIGAVVATFSGFPIVWLQWPHTNVFILFPLILFITEKIFTKPKAIFRWYILLSIVYCIGVFGGHPETLFHIFVLQAFYVMVRFWKAKQAVLRMALFIVAGFLLSSIQLVPFLEYLMHSAALQSRIAASELFALPISSLMLYVFPFLLGAPHIDFYKSLTEATNYQEIIGGYTGVVVLAFAILGGLMLRKNPLVAIWTGMVAGIMLVVFNIWPFGFIAKLPLFNISANNRLVGFVAFGICVLFAFFLDWYQKSTKQSLEKINTFLTVCFILIIGLAIVGYFIPIPQNFNFSYREQEFLQLLRWHIVFILLTISGFIFLLQMLRKRKLLKSRYIYILLIPVLLQTAYLFWDYNSFTKKGEYYPDTDLTRKLQSLPQGTYLEVGNLNLPENMNLVYGLSQAENYDAIDIASYKDTFNHAFPVKNHWKKVDAVTLESLQRLGIRYVISDFNPNLVRQAIQSKAEKLSLPIMDSTYLQISFKPQYAALREIRVLPANFNRKNSCSLVFRILDSSLRMITEVKIDCKSIRDKMFHTIPLKAALSANNDYVFAVSAEKANKENAIALWVDDSGKPYLELFFDDNKVNDFKKIWKENSISLWEVPNIEDVVIQGDYKIIERQPEKLHVVLDAKREGIVEIKQNFYSGWEAKVDGKPVKVENLHPFTGVYIPEGKHELVLEYRPTSFIIGLLISAITFLGLITYWVYNERRVIYRKKVM